jgi:hypothetical protein
MPRPTQRMAEMLVQGLLRSMHASLQALGQRGKHSRVAMLFVKNSARAIRSGGSNLQRLTHPLHPSMTFSVVVGKTKERSPHLAVSALVVECSRQARAFFALGLAVSAAGSGMMLSPIAAVMLGATVSLAST